jgi:predicted negative regulator of RcsB-dependent stress response
MFLLIVVFGVGVFVGYKYPQQVAQAVQSSKNIFNDLKDKISKKSS